MHVLHSLLQLATIRSTGVLAQYLLPIFIFGPCRVTLIVRVIGRSVARCSVGTTTHTHTVWPPLRALCHCMRLSQEARSISSIASLSCHLAARLQIDRSVFVGSRWHGRRPIDRRRDLNSYDRCGAVRTYLRARRPATVRRSMDGWMQSASGARRSQLVQRSSQTCGMRAWQETMWRRQEETKSQRETDVLCVFVMTGVCGNCVCRADTIDRGRAKG